METLIGILFISVIGTLLHFLYDISNHNKVISLFSAVNESVWEHIKMALTPSFLWGIYDGFIHGTNSNYFFAKVVSILLIIIVIPLIFYGYKLITKKTILIIDILTFYIAIVISQITFKYILQLNFVNGIVNYISAIILFIIFGAYMTLTLFPIKNNLFKDPITKEYGLKGHNK